MSPEDWIAHWHAPAAEGGRAGLWDSAARWQAAGVFRALDLAYGRWLAQESPQASDLALWLAMWCSARLAHGDVCVDLRALCAEPRAVLARAQAVSARHEAGAAALLADSRALADALAQAGEAACRQALDDSGFTGDGEGGEPMVRQDARLYLARYWRAVRRILAALHERVDAPVPADGPDDAERRRWLDALFPPAGAETPDWQKIACAIALDRPFCIVAGGPGTGKTSTVVRLLAALQGQALQRTGQAAHVLLAAPTGKAAARLNDSIGAALQRLRAQAPAFVQPALDAIPTQARTIHRVLGTRPESRQFRHHARKPLTADVLVIDEASMLDIEMLDAVLAALRPGARLVLLGDKDQLASVEAGAVLGELCARAEAGHYTPATCERLQALAGQQPPASLQDPCGLALDQAIVMLRTSRRFAGDSGIGRLAGAINRGDAARLRQLHADPPHDLAFHVPAGLRDAQVDALLCEGHAAAGQACPDEAGGYGAYLQRMLTGRPAEAAGAAAIDAWAWGILQARARFQVLCALRNGPWGARGLNQRIEQRLRERGWLAPAEGPWYAGRPVLITRNQYELGLANGDMGVALPVYPSDGSPRLRVAFARDDEPGAVRWISPSRLGEAETVYALTVHKSQGSEFDQVVLVLPEAGSPLLSRELFYTGATRARHHLGIIAPGGLASLAAAAARPTRRASGLAWSDGEPRADG